MSLPAIGVVIPCYKAEHTLRQTVESVLQGAPDNLQLWHSTLQVWRSLM